MDIRSPRCSKDFVRPVQEDGVAERLASLFYLHALTCQLCAHRFRAWQWPVGDPGLSDQRQHERLHVNCPMTFVGDAIQEGPDHPRSFPGRPRVQDGAGPASEALVQLRLHAPSRERPLVVEAAVVRSVRPPLFG